VSLFWSRYNTWEPQGGHHKPWKDLERGDLIEADRKAWRVIEVRPVPVVDWDEHDREYYDRLVRQHRNPQYVPMGRPAPPSEEEWDYRPVYLILVPADGGKRHHLRIPPYSHISRGAWVLSPHYPVCKDCGELWPCHEVEITQEVDKQAAELAKLEKILPGCCWSCGEPVTRKQGSIGFDGDNLLLPGAPSPVFHLRRKGQCRSAAASYEKRWVAAREGRRWRLQCPGKLIRHVDGDECTEDPFCPGGNASHGTFIRHSYGRLPDGSIRSVYGADFRCLRCEDALERRALALGEPPDGALL
jgi:hypothetical protein